MHNPITVGVFDSGVGGLSVLRAIRDALPGIRHVYVADSGFAPYGERRDDYVIDRARRITNFLQAQGASVIVIACNTATAAAISHLRSVYPETLFVGVEPGLKPAVAISRNKIVGVLATAGTLRSEKFARLLRPFETEARIHLQACPGLARAIELADLHSPEITSLVERYCAPLREAEADTVVLGCTHYPFAMASIQRALGARVQLIDTAIAVARQTAAQVQNLIRQFSAQRGSADPAGGPTEPALGVTAYTTGDVDSLRRICGAWLDFEVAIQPMP